MAELLRGACNTRSYLHQLLTLLAKVDQLLQSVGVRNHVMADGCGVVKGKEREGGGSGGGRGHFGKVIMKC